MKTEASGSAPLQAKPAPRFHALRRWGAWLATRTHDHRWGLVVALVTGLLAGWVYARTATSHVPYSDGFYSFIYARSLAFDGDLDFTNDYALCGDPFHIGLHRGTGHPDNLFYAGPALFWVPLLWLLRLVLGRAAGNGCGHPITTYCLALSPVVGGLATYWCYCLARRLFSDGVAALSAALLALGGPLLQFAGMLPSYSHVYDLLCVAGLLLLTVRATEAPERWQRWAWVAVALGASVLQRVSNAAFVVVPLSCALVAYRGRWRAWAGVAGLLAVGLALGLLPVALIYHHLYGRVFVFTHGRYFLQLSQAHPWLLLFNREQGLFFFTPTVWLAVIGLVPALRHRPSRPWLWPLIGIAAMEWYLSAAALDWAPARRLMNLTPLFVVLAGFPLRWLGARLATPARALALAGVLVALPFVTTKLGFTWGVPRRIVPTQRALPQREAYGESGVAFWSMLDDTVGDVAIWPAEVVFALRYGLPPQRFGEAAHPRWYARDFRTLRWEHQELSLADGDVQRLLVGFLALPRGARPAAERARLVFAAQWPFATKVEVRLQGARSGRLRVGQGRAFGEPLWFGAAQPLRPGSYDYVFEVPDGGFGSGLNEFVFAFDDADRTDLVVTAVRIDDRAPRLPALAP